MVWAGPRVTQVMAQDHRLWRWFSKKTKSNVPQRAISLQTTITLMLLFTGTFEQVIIYSSFVLQLFAALVVAGVFVVRHKNKIKSGFRRPLFPHSKNILSGTQFLGASLFDVFSTIRNWFGSS